MNLSEAQARHKEWSERNFPDRNPDHPLVGVIEEVGELCEAVLPQVATSEALRLIIDLQAQLGRLAHVHLKRAQGIRKASTSFDRECDAVDRIAALFDRYQNLIGYPAFFTELLPEDRVDDPTKAADAVADIQIYLLDFCGRRGIDAGTNLAATLDQVLARDWVKNPTTGKAV